MFKKLLISTLALVLFSVQTHASTNSGLKHLFDELNYSLTVEWDQKDKVFYDNQMEKFTKELEALSLQGVSHQEIVEYALAHVKDKKVAKDLRTTMALVGISKMTKEEARSYVKNILEKNYSQGASWAGEAAAGVLVVFILVLVAGLVSGLAKLENGCYKLRSCTQSCSLGYCYRDCDYNCWY